MEKSTAKGLVSVARLVIRENRIERCMNSIQREIPERLWALMGYGGISLADAEALVIEDNSILGNGPDFLEPICGIFILKGSGIEITRNRILDNGARNGKEATAKTVKRGPRGGIHITLAQSPGPGALSGSRRAGSPWAGVPALKVHDNVVTVPMGRSLTVIAQGPVSAIGNRFTSFGIPPVDFRSLLLAVAADKSLKAEAMWELLNLVAGNVFILDQGRLALVPATDSGYGNIQSGTAAKAYEANARPAAAQAGSNRDRRFAAGTVLFADNQCHQDLATPEPSFAVSSIFIASLDDVGFHANQCDCDLDGDFLLANAFIFGMTSRTSDNRFRESLAKAMFSAATFGIQNVTTDNESIHCLLVLGIAYLNRHNLVLAEIATIKGDVTKAIGAHPCDAALKLFKNFGGD